MAPEALARRVTAALLVCGCAIACGHRASEITATWSIEPSPPRTGAPTHVRVLLRHRDGNAIHGAKLKLEGHMSHPGMTPLVADVNERGDGAYEARIDLSMPGDWVFVMTGELKDGRRITEHVAVPAVRPPG